MSSVTPISGQAAATARAVTPSPTGTPGGTVPLSALASPYDGTVPTALGAATPLGSQVPALTGLGMGAGTEGPSRQVNATNQTAIAPGGTINQTVTNENQFTNKYYNIIVPNPAFGGYAPPPVGILGTLGGMLGLGGSPAPMLGGYGPYGGMGYGPGSWNTPGNSFIDPQTGVMYVQKDTGITGWFKRLFRGW